MLVPLTFALSCSGAPQGTGGTEAFSQESPFTLEVEEFVRNFRPGGQDWTGRGEALPPEEALRRFRLAEGLEIDLVAHEPLVRKPLNLHFDERGRLWVVQYLQYPFPAGLKVVEYDMYLRATFDGVPPAPPHHVRGADKITILEDTNGDGRFDSHKDFVTGLNITTSVAVGRGGVWVLNPPYLLFYPDGDRDDVPDGDPEVRLSGFGLEDTHSVVNSLHWGPDGWLYAAQGSTTTATINDRRFLGQAIWRYHPETSEFEVFAEGGGNTFSLDFDSKGRAFSGTNYVNRGMHYVQGAYYVKGFTKHGPLTNPFAFGYLQHMKHTGLSERFSQAFGIYEGGALPQYEGQIISGMAMTNKVQATRLVPHGSTFRTEDSEDSWVALTDDLGFRPVDVKFGPDGAVYVADWYDLRVSHLNPYDTWDKSRGRIYRIRAKGAQPVQPFDLGSLSGEGLIDYLSHSNRWFREQARRLLGDRRDPSVVPRLKRLVEQEAGQLALEALWALYVSDGFDEEFATAQLDHANPHVRAWTVRLLGDARSVSPSVRERLVERAHIEREAEVRSQLAASAKRLPARQSFPIVRELLLRSEDADDLKIPLLLWWAIEDKVTGDAELVLELASDRKVWQSPIFRQTVASRLGQRYAAERGDRPSYTLKRGAYSEWFQNYSSPVVERNLTTCARLLERAPGPREIDLLVAGMEKGLSGEAVRQVPSRLQARVDQIWRGRPRTPVLVRFAARLGHEEAARVAVEQLKAAGIREEDRAPLVDLLSERRVTPAIPVLLNLLRSSPSEARSLHLLKALSRFEDPEVAEAILRLYPSMDLRLRQEARAVLIEKPAWARLLLESVDRGEFPAEHLTDSNLQAILRHGDARSAQLVEKHRASLEAGSAERELQALHEKGRKSYELYCASCHLESGQGLMGLAPSLVDSGYLGGLPDNLVRIVLHGKEGPSMRMVMPPLGNLEDEQIAAVLTYVRREWGQNTEPVSAELVARIRELSGSRRQAWTEKELQELLE